MLELAPIVLFTYNRPIHTKMVLDALANNKESKDSILYIYCDGHKETATDEDMNNINETRLIVKKEKRFKEVIIKEQNKNKGLANSIIDGVTEVISKYEKVIVVEDDIVTSPYFLEFMNDALKKYSVDNEVACINAYVYPVKEKLPETFFIKGADCWGWATWKRAWDIFESDGEKLLNEIESKGLNNEFDFNGSYPYTQMLKDQISGTNNSWAIRWYASAFVKNMLCLYPGVSLVQNIGIDGSGINSGNSEKLAVTLSASKINVNSISLKENEIAKQSFINYFWSLSFYHPTFLRRVINKLKRVIK